jgi:hypothetical protein
MRGETDTLRDALQTATITAAAAELEARRGRNLELLRQVMPEAWERYREYSPERFEIRWNASTGSTLVEMESGASIYPGDPGEHARAQVEAFRAEPMVWRSKFMAKDVLQMERTLHPRLVNEVMEVLTDRAEPAPAGLPEFVNTLFVFGLGLGYHLPALLQAADVRHLCIVEPDADLFHASLYTVEWTALAEHFARPGYSLQLVVDRSAAEAVADMDGWLDSIGGFNLVESFIFQHLGGEVLTQTLDGLLNVVLPRYTSALGYFDDERVGLAHTVANVEAGRPVLASGVEQTRSWIDRPAWVVANGPSLDDAVGFLRENRSSAVVISCGTALGSLVRAGIRPDIHVEMERTRPVVEWIEQATTREDRDRILMVGMNTVHPDAFDLFPRSVMIAKPNDIGSAWMDRRNSEGTPLPRVHESNPTVGNLGIATAAFLGFRDITIFGMDLGFPENGQHHSKHSVHYRVGARHRDTLGVYRVDDPANPRGKGNFGGVVRTTPVYVGASRAVGRMAMRYPHLRLRNTANGLIMPGAEPTPLDTLESGPPFDTGRYAADLLARHTRSGIIAPAAAEEREQVRAGIEDVAKAARDALSAEPSSRAECMLPLMAAHLTLAGALERPELVDAVRILQGSMAHFSLILAKAAHSRQDEPSAVELYRDCREVVLRFLDEVVHTASSGNLFALDDRTRELSKKIEAA